MNNLLINQETLEDLLIKIHRVNHSWKLAQKITENEHILAQSLRNLKIRLQIKLLRNYAPDYVFLQLDENIMFVEPIYGLKLNFPVNGYHDAAHFPVRVAHQLLSDSEINYFSTTINASL